MQCGEELDLDDMALIESQMVPPAVPALEPVGPTIQPVDLRSLAAQLPDLSHLDNITVNI